MYHSRRNYVLVYIPGRLRVNITYPHLPSLSAGHANVHAVLCTCNLLLLILLLKIRYPQIIGKYKNGTSASLNATATIGEDGSSIVLTATATNDFTPTASSYGRASWPRTVFYAMAVSDGSIQNPVIPWFSNFSTINPWHPPAYEENKPLVPRGIVGVDGF